MDSSTSAWTTALVPSELPSSTTITSKSSVIAGNASRQPLTIGSMFGSSS